MDGERIVFAQKSELRVRPASCAHVILGVDLEETALPSFVNWITGISVGACASIALAKNSRLAQTTALAKMFMGYLHNKVRASGDWNVRERKRLC